MSSLLSDIRSNNIVFMTISNSYSIFTVLQFHTLLVLCIVICQTKCCLCTLGGQVRRKIKSFLPTVSTEDTRFSFYTRKFWSKTLRGVNSVLTMCRNFLCSHHLPFFRHVQCEQKENIHVVTSVRLSLLQIVFIYPKQPNVGIRCG